MIKSTFFTGFGFDPQSAMNNANAQADTFIQNGNGRRIEVSRTFINFNNNGSVYSASLQLNYSTQ